MRLRTVAVVAALSLASAGAFASPISSTLMDIGGGVWSGTFGNTVLTGPWSDTVTFTPAMSGLATGSVISVALNGVGLTGDLDFTAVSLNGNPFVITNGLVSQALLTTPTVVNAPLVLSISGTGQGGSYSGTFNINAVPEPGTLALLGLAGLGAGLVRRRQIVK
jgi:hypothetical protein